MIEQTVVELKTKVENILNIEQKEVVFLIVSELKKAQGSGVIIPDVVFELIDKVEKEYANTIQEGGHTEDTR